ncbi:integrase core domain-containing protein, partial [Shewanella surugensis]
SFLVIAMFLLLIVDRPRSINRLHRNALSSYTRNDYSSLIVRRSFKTEWMPRAGFTSFDEANRAISHYIVRYYNQVRPHQYNGGLTPMESERLFEQNSKSVAKIS